MVGRNPALTHWAMICRPSGPWATALGGVEWIGIGIGIEEECLLRRTDPLRKGCFAAMNGRSAGRLQSSVHAPGEGTRPTASAEVHRDRTRLFLLSFSIPIPIPIPTRAARVDWAGFSSAWGLCGLSVSYSGAMERRSDLGVRGEGVLSPLPGLGIDGGRNPALTRWAIVCRPSGPGATDWAQGCEVWFRVVGVLRGETSTFELSLGAELADASTPPGLFAFLA
jgi:hypothetical protein